MSNQIKIVEYQPYVHSVEQLAQEQNEAVDTGEAKMLKWNFIDGRLVFPHKHPFYLGFMGTTAVAGAGFNIEYDPGGCVELGAAYVGVAARGQGMYHELTAARLSYASKMGLEVMTFANEVSGPILLRDFGFRPAEPEDVPKQAFELCSGCDGNPVKPLPACLEICCDRESILKI